MIKKITIFCFLFIGNFKTLSFAGEDVSSRHGSSLPKYFVLNKTGNILISTTDLTGNLPLEARKEFNQVITFLKTMSLALLKEELNLNSPNAMEKIIRESNLFIETECIDYTISKKEKGQNSFISFFKKRKKNKDLKTVDHKGDGHILFFLEYILGITSISVEIHYLEDNNDQGSSDRMESRKRTFLYIKNSDSYFDQSF